MRGVLGLIVEDEQFAAFDVSRYNLIRPSPTEWTLTESAASGAILQMRALGLPLVGFARPGPLLPPCLRNVPLEHPSFSTCADLVINLGNATLPLLRV